MQMNPMEIVIVVILSFGLFILVIMGIMWLSNRRYKDPPKYIKSFHQTWGLMNYNQKRVFIMSRLKKVVHFTNWDWGTGYVALKDHKHTPPLFGDVLLVDGKYGYVIALMFLAVEYKGKIDGKEIYNFETTYLGRMKK